MRLEFYAQFNGENLTFTSALVWIKFNPSLKQLFGTPETSDIN